MVQSLINPQSFWLYFLATTAVGMAGAGFYDVLLRWLEEPDRSIFGPLLIAAGAAILVIVLAWSLFKFASRKTMLRPSGGRVAEKRKGLILLLSPNKNDKLQPAAVTALKHHEETLTHAWILHSAESEDEAVQISAQFSSINIQLRLMQDVKSIQSFYNEIEAIFSNLPPDFTETDVVTDFTGMTKFASIGAVLACHSVERALQYVDIPDKSSEVIPPIEVVFVLEELAPSSRRPGRDVHQSSDS